MPENLIDSVKTWYTVKLVGDKNQFWCKKCTKGWELPVDNNHPGNYLTMMNHAFEHKAKKSRGTSGPKNLRDAFKI